MNHFETFAKLLEIQSDWQIIGIHLAQDAKRVEFRISERNDIWMREKCPSCGCPSVSCHDHVAARSWRHLNSVNLETVITCSVPRGRCKQCGRVYGINPPWQGKSKHFTKEFEMFLLVLMKEMPVKRVAKLVEESDQKLWRMLFAHVENAQTQLSVEAVKIVRQQWSRRKP